MASYIKRANRSATLSFCPGGPFLAAGSVAGAIDLSFSTASQLEIFRLDFSSTDQDLRLAGGAVQAPERFSRLCWGPAGVDTKHYPYGLIAGGLADGSVCVWNPARIIGHKAEAAVPASPAATRGQLLARLQKHQGAVKGLEFNGFSPNLLASGGADGELCIWDVGNPMQPSLYPAMKGGAGGPQPEITHLAWNRKVQHILGTCTAAGTVVVWDLKKQRPVISFKDPSGRKRCSALQWNPEVATQLVVASDDDMAPSLQLWDLRNSVSPIREFHGHAKGVLAMSWCPQDSSFLLSSGKDNRTICWDVGAGEMYCELPPAANWNFDWAPGPLAGVFATATFEGQVGITSLSTCTAAGEADGFAIGQGATTAYKTKAPAWLKRPVGATLGFGGKLAQFANSKRQLATGEAAVTGSVTISQVMTEPELVARSEAFEAAIRGGDRDALDAFCRDMERRLEGSEEAETWAFLQTHFAADGRKYLLERLGFGEYLPVDAEAAAAAAAAEASAAGGEGDAAAAADAFSAAAAAAEGVQQMGLEAPAGAAAAEQLLAGDGADFFEQSPVTDGAAFFDNLAGTPPRPTSALSPAKRSAPASPSQAAPGEGAVVDGPPGEREADIQRMLFVGNYAGAVEACLEAKRHADALVVSSVNLMEKAVVLGVGVNRHTASEALSDLIVRYAELLAANGRLGTALDYLSMIPGEPSTGVAVLKERIYSSAAGSDQLPPGTVPPPFPFSGEDVAAGSWQQQQAAAPAAYGAQAGYGAVAAQAPQPTYQAQQAQQAAPSYQPYSAQGGYAAAQQQQQQLNGYGTAATTSWGGGGEYSTGVAAVAPPPQSPAQQQQQQYQAYGGGYGSAVPPAPPAAYQPAAAAYGAPPSPAGTPTSAQPHPVSYQQQQAAYQPAAAAPAVYQPSAAASAPAVYQPSAAQVAGPPAAAQVYQPSAAPAATYQQAPAAPGPSSGVYQPASRAGSLAGGGQLPSPSFVPHQGPAVPPGMAPPPARAGPTPTPITAPPPPPPGPPANITLANADTSSVPAHLQPIVASLTNLYRMCEMAAGAHPGKKREVEDSSRKLGALFWRMNKGEVSQSVGTKLLQLCQALDGGDLVSLTTSDWDECSAWLTALKRLIKARQMMG
ncbi:hypothetical protein CHLNCDRAFT_143487 [Chlorella variabilis]|uniref:Uncharacterized protein n=1 Tax=Chlorella variabilis TaxID=554065 RepID=E1ZB08_CHLVA|nr:hypothetical protein CHLNCDRAFT_143487 [Chlorella variabilis]EFN56942.1 hypothetical protein CHLNCDRAFT_143487 [Chlorella variabilis]|eukprot:XP_005849044.1 hypothetical protein CHLNCDRAFT_143487 [Chlorella variabilis]